MDTIRNTKNSDVQADYNDKMNRDLRDYKLIIMNWTEQL